MERRNKLDIREILKILPQRPPFLFIDKVIEADPEEAKVVCIKNITANDYFFKGHFPGNPVMPGVLILEAMAQASIILFAVMKPEVAKRKPTYYFGKTEARFLKPAGIGDRLEIEVRPLKMLRGAGMVKAIARVNNENVASAQISFGVKLEENE